MYLFLTLYQISKSNEYLRTHHLEVIWFDFDNINGLVERTSTKLVVSGQLTKLNHDQLIGKERPALMFINYHDHAYARVLLDDTVHIN